MCSNNTIEPLKALANRSYQMPLSEVDTQVLLVEPILRLLGWKCDDPDEVRRAGRGPSDSFDVRLYGRARHDSPRIVVACKALASVEFLLPGNRANGKLAYQNGKWDQPETGNGNRNKDGLAQLRRYCVNRDRNFDPDYSIAVLTNGKTWVAFKGNEFVTNPGAPVPTTACLFQPIAIDDDGFLEAIRQNLRNV